MAVDIELRQQTVGEVLRLLEARGERVIDLKEEDVFWREVIQICQYFGVEEKLSNNPTEILGILKIKVSFEDEGLGLDEVVRELNRRIGEAIERPELESRVPTQLLDGLLREFDDHQANLELEVERLAKSPHGKYLNKQDIRNLLEQKRAQRRQIEIDLRKQRPEVSEAEITEIADRQSDARLKVEARLREETTKPTEEIRELARKVAEVVVEPDLKKEDVKLRFEDPLVAEVAQDLVAEARVEAKLGVDISQNLRELAVEKEREMRTLLGDRSEEIVAEVIGGGDVESVVAGAKLGRAEAVRATRGLEMVAGFARVEVEVERRIDEVTAKLSDVLGITDDEGIREIRKITNGRVRGVLTGEMTMLDEPRVVELTDLGTGVVMAPRIMNEIGDVIGGVEIPKEREERVNLILEEARKGLENFQKRPEATFDWRRELTRRGVRDVLVINNGGKSGPVLEDYASKLADMAESESGINQWRNVALSNLEAQQENLADNEKLSASQRENAWKKIEDISKILKMSPGGFNAAVEARNKIVETVGETAIDGAKLGRVGIYDQICKLAGENEGLKSMLNFVQKKVAFFEQFNNLGFQVFSRLGGEELAIRLAERFMGQAGAEFAKEGLLIMAEQGTGAGIRFGLEKIAGQLAIKFGVSSAAGAAAGGVTTGAMAAAGAATGPPGWVITVIVIGVQLAGKAVGWLVGKIKGVFGGMLGALGIDTKMFDAVGGIKNFLKENGLGFVNAPLNLLEKFLGLFGMDWLARDVGNLIIWVVGGVFLGLFVFMTIITGPLISAMVPPGRGVGGDTTRQPTRNGYLIAPPWQGDPATLPEACPPDAPAISGRITQGPNAISCSHSGLNNVIDVAVSNKTPLVSPNAGIISGPIFDSSGGYGLYIDLMAKCNGVIYATRFAHLDQGAGVSDRVEVGTVIGYTDNTGNSTGPHLHQEIRGLTTDYFSRWKGCCGENNGISCEGR